MSRIDRRACLKGLGVSLALPLMDSLGWADTTKGKEEPLGQRGAVKADSVPSENPEDPQQER